jgi:TRAP transporter TAXI family solute receptor
MSRDAARLQRSAQRREMLLIAAPAIALAAAALWLAYQFVEPAPPRTVVMSTGSAKGAYHLVGTRYAEILARSGVKLDLKTSNGSKENASRLMDMTSGVKVALVQGGAVLAKDAPNLVSLGRVYQQPLWIFYRGDEVKTRLMQFKGLKLAIGPDGSGTRAMVTELLSATKITNADTQFLGPENDTAASMLMAGEADAIFLATGADSPVVKRLLSADGIKLVNLEQADAYIRINPHLGKVVLPQGMLDLEKNVPPADVTMLAPQASLLARDDLHPAIIGLLVNAAKEVHTQAGMFQRMGEYPQASDPEIPMSEDAARAYTTGKTFLHRHLPFWVATFIERMAIMLLPLATILLPLVKVLPWVYQWRIRKRIWYWYGQLKRLEQHLGQDAPDLSLAAARQDIDRIDDAARVIPIPLRYSLEYYSLRSAIALVRQRIAASVEPEAVIPVYEARASL